MAGKKWWLLNIVLALVLTFILWQRVYLSHIRIDCSHGAKPTRLLKLLEQKGSPTQAKSLRIVFVFGGIPDAASVEAIQKLYMMNMDKVGFFAFYTTRGKSEIPSGIPFLRPIKKRISCIQRAVDFYLILEGEKIDYFDSKFDLFRINLVLQQRIQTPREFAGRGISVAKLIARINERFQQGPVSLWNAASGTIEPVTLSDRYSQVAFFHASCSSYELNNYMKRVQKGEGKTLVIFSFFAVSTEIQRGKAAYEIATDIFVDQMDEFNLKQYSLGAAKNPTYIEIQGEYANDHK